MDPRRFLVTAPGRIVVGVLLMLTGVGKIAFGHDLDWGVGWTTWVPGIALYVVGWGLAGRRELHRSADGLEIRVGWLWRRSLTLPDDGSYALLPTAGLLAVVARLDDGRGGQVEVPLATWVGRRRAEALAAWLEQSSGWRRVSATPPAGDR
jgi:hypothetical protein